MSAKKRNIVIRFLAVMFVLGLLAFAAYGQDLSVKIIRTAGKVEVRASGQTAWAKAATGKLLKPGDTLRTLKGGKVQLMFPHNTLVIIKENSVLNVKELKAEGGAKVKTVMGGFLFNLQEALSPGSTFEIETPTALAVVRGTKLGVDVDLDGTSDFTGYDNNFDVIAQGVTRGVGAGLHVVVNPGEAPGEPESTEATWEGDGGEDEAAESPTYTEQQYMSRFNTLANRFRLLNARANEFYQEYVRYESAGDTARVELLYYNYQPIIEQCDQLDEAVNELINALSADPTLGWIIVGDEPLPGTEESGAAINGYITTCRDSSAQIRSWYDSIEGYLSATGDLREILDDVRGVIESTDPARDIRYGNIDTDNDGVPDVVELNLQGEVNAEEPMIVLISPDDSEQFAYPDDSSILYEFEATGENYFTGFELHLMAGGHEMVRQFVGNSMDLSIEDIVTGSSSPFIDLFSEGESVEFTWFVRGMFDFQQWGADTGETHHTSAVITIDSETRSFDLSFPVGQIVDFGLTVIGPTPVTLGEPVRLRLDVDEISLLARWEIIVNYDPSMVEFTSGLRSGITNGTTLFFGDDGRGRMTISGEIPTGRSPLEGSGAFAEISFMTLETGMALFSFSDIRLYTESGGHIGATDGGSAEVEIANPLGV